ncbi:DNA polymerase-3 subunit alpha [Oribacterium sp. KHPX15]|uniref:3'-5' exonuclease n=1 Tax=Oribacterium sp. KHPX15 TaxID=1855342 RepID=UPI00089D78D1|nr:exonuclease domain-containing protein [Oribacterium sp. KHPX15]SEA70239.1 DNA polymerase-3 subunit alpha [Oribacterium sp. KHPX15]
MKLHKFEDFNSLTVNDSYVVLDIETTGFSSEKDKIIDISAVKIVNGKRIDHFSTLVNPGIVIPRKITNLTSITNEMLKDAPPCEEVIRKFMAFCMGSVLVSHNAEFSMSFLKHAGKDLDLDVDISYIDTLTMSRVLLPELEKFGLDKVASALNILYESDRTIDRAECTVQVFLKLLKMYDGEQDCH